MKKILSSILKCILALGLTGSAATIAALMVNQMSASNYNLALAVGGILAFGILIVESVAYRSIRLALRVNGGTGN